MAEATVLFHRANDAIDPTEHAVGPWSDERLHGGAVAGLLAEVIEPHRPPEQQVGVFRLELFGPVPFVRLRPKAEVVRTGKKMSVIDASLSDETTVLARATAITVRAGSGGGPDAISNVDSGRPDDGVEPPSRVRSSSPFFAGIDFRVLEGGLGAPGPARLWARINHVWFAGETPTPVTRLLAVADSAYGYGMPVTSSDWLATNVDVTVHLQRRPSGHWTYFNAATDVGANGIGVGRAQVADAEGRLGHVSQIVVASPTPHPTQAASDDTIS